MICKSLARQKEWLKISSLLMRSPSHTESSTKPFDNSLTAVKNEWSLFSHAIENKPVVFWQQCPIVKEQRETSTTHAVFQAGNIFGLKAWLFFRAQRMGGTRWQQTAMPQIGYKIEYAHVGLIHPGLIHGRHASQRMGLVATSPVLHTQWRALPRRAMNHHQETLAYMM